MARKKKHEEHENHERWLVSYADFITLLFAFFVVMYSISSVNEGKYRVLSDAIVAAFRSAPKSMEPIQVGNPAKSTPAPTPEVRHKPTLLAPIQSTLPPPPENEKNVPAPSPVGNVGTGIGGASAEELAQMGRVIKTMADAIERAMAPMIDKHLISVRRDELWLEVEINSTLLFPSGSAVLHPDLLSVLKEIADILKPFPNPVRVEGFTDTVPIRTLAYPSNWELSAARAASVVHQFVKGGVDPLRLAAIGYGEHRPLMENITEAGRSKNRRVVIVVLENLIAGSAYEAQQLQEATRAAAAAPDPGQTETPVAMPPDAARGEGGYITEREPVDVTSQEHTDTGKFPVIRPPIKILTPPVDGKARGVTHVPGGRV